MSPTVSEPSSALEAAMALAPIIPAWGWIALGWVVGLFTPSLQQVVQRRLVDHERLEMHAWLGQAPDGRGNYRHCLFGKAVNVTDIPVNLEWSYAQVLGNRRWKLLGRRETHLVVQGGTEDEWPFPRRLERSDSIERPYFLPLIEDWDAAVRMRVVYEDARNRKWVTKWLAVSTAKHGS